MRGWTYLNGLLWEQVTRDERFFCQRLYALGSQDPARLVRTLNTLSPSLALDEDAEWEIGFEVCFFRDLRHLMGDRWTEDRPYSPKRTFDLCLFSEKRIVIIEAKAQQSFESNSKQWENFAQEPELVRQALAPHDVEVSMLTIASGKYLKTTTKEFGLHPVSWADLAVAYGNDPMLARAEAVFDQPSSGQNNEGYRTGEELMAAALEGRKLLVGRQGGISGAQLQQDIISGAWRTRWYETRAATDRAPNANWFPLEQFGRLVK